MIVSKIFAILAYVTIICLNFVEDVDKKVTILNIAVGLLAGCLILLLFKMEV